MGRHSTHANDRHFYSYKERQDAGYVQTRKEVLGTDCFLPFGHCALTLKAPKDPVVTPQGWVYEKEAILESLLTQKLELQAQQKKYEEQERKKARKEAASKQEEDMREVTEFQQNERAILSGDYRHKRALGEDTVDDGRPETKLRKGELLNVDKSKMREKSFWAKEATQTAAPTELKAVDTATKCPMSGKKLRKKDLLPLKFEITDQKMYDQGGERGVFCCAVSKHPITHQQAVLIKPSGVVVLESVVKDMVLKDMRCPITSKPIKGKEDILKLQMGGTGFRAHNEVEAKSVTPGGIRSHTGDARTQSGHLPKAGYCGLH